jgi:hypothetical protein
MNSRAMLSFTGINIDLLCAANGGQAQPDGQLHQTIGAEIDLENARRDTEKFRDWERRHPIRALIRQGDRSGLRR